MKNPELIKLGPLSLSPRDSAVLVLTNKRTIQQKYGYKIHQTSGFHRPVKQFHLLPEPPKFCNAMKSLFITEDSTGISSIQKKGIPCMQWACPACGPKKVIKLRNLLVEVAKLNILDRFLTLTLNPEHIPPEYIKPVDKTGAYITLLWNHFITVLKRKIHQPLLFIWIKQFQKNGNAHLHILTNRFLPKELLVYHWNRIGGGHILDIQKVKNLEAASVYISRYLTEGIQTNRNSSHGFFVGEHRYSISRGCILPKKQSSDLKRFHTMYDLEQPISISKFFELYDILLNPDKPDGEYFIAPHQEPLPV